VGPVLLHGSTVLANPTWNRVAAADSGAGTGGVGVELVAGEHGVTLLAIGCWRRSYALLRHGAGGGHVSTTHLSMHAARCQRVEVTGGWPSGDMRPQ